MSQDRTQTPTSVHTAPHDMSESLRRMKLADAKVSRPARRTLGQMMPGYERQPVLTLYRPQFSNDTPCIFCDQWLCPGNCRSYAPAPSGAALKAAV
ncbi:hypothetical protein [Streptomyces sp. NPDC056069]|uniref:hypothetical protein n=1 Tax=Streptomyces sp. NPDC056069 TaxID=3345702 RepID=UPI0035DF2E8A